MSTIYCGRKTPDPTKYVLRKEAGFGCCICGLPIIQYHHIVPWSEEEHFRPEDMMVLCPNHHDQATKGALSVAQQRRAKKSPINRVAGRISGLLTLPDRHSGIRVGTNIFMGESVSFHANNVEVLSFTSKNRALQISARIYGKNGDLLAVIDKNEWIVGDVEPWDIEADWDRLLVRSRKYDIRFFLNARERLIKLPPKITGKFYVGGTGFRVTKEAIMSETMTDHDGFYSSGCGYYNHDFYFLGDCGTLAVEIRAKPYGGGMILRGPIETEADEAKLYNETKRAYLENEIKRWTQ